jgi:hypothetical protein
MPVAKAITEARSVLQTILPDRDLTVTTLDAPDVDRESCYRPIVALVYDAPTLDQGRPRGELAA